MIKIDEIVLSQDAPLSTRVVWAHPVEGDKIELLVYNNGEWCKTSSEEMDLSDYQLKIDEEGYKYMYPSINLKLLSL